MQVDQLQQLNLSMNKIDYLAEKVFTGLKMLKVLDLSGNRIQYIHGSLPNNFPLVYKLISSHSHICCIVSIEICVAPLATFSCTNLLQNIGIKVWIYFLAPSIIVLNIIVIIIHRLSESNNASTYLIQLLAFSDLLYGIYLSIITLSDMVHGDQYALHDLEWRSSVTCNIAAILSSLSFIMAAITVTLLAVVRCEVITKNGNIPYWMTYIFQVYGTVFILFSVTSLSIIIAASQIHGQLYQPNALCIMLLSTVNESLFLSSFALMATFLLIPLFIIICVSYIRIYLHTREVNRSVTKLGTVSGHSSRTRALTLNMTLVIMSNVLCWIPILVISFLLNIQIGIDIMAVIVVCMMPINSIINPLLYTFKTSK